MQEEYGIKLKILTDSFKNSIMQVKGMIHNFKNDIKQDTDVNFTIDSNLTLKQLQKFKSDIESELAKLQESSKIGAGMKVVDPDEERKIKNLTAGLTMVKERIAEIGNEADDTKQKMSGISINATMTNNTIVNGFKNSWKSIKRFAFSLLSLRGIYGLVRKASSAYMSQDTGLAQQMQRTWASVGAMLAPIIETIVKWIRIGAAYLNYFIKALTGKDLIGKAVKKINKYNKSLGGTAKAAKSVNKELTNMDEVTNLNLDDGNINNFSDGISNVGDAFDDFSDIKLDKNITKFLDDVAEKLKIVGNFLKPVIDWAIKNPGAVLTILGGAKLLSMLTTLTGGSIGGGLLGVLAASLTILAAIKIAEVKDAYDKLNDAIRKNTKMQQGNTRQHRETVEEGQKQVKNVEEITDGVKKYNDTLLQGNKRIKGQIKATRGQYTALGKLTGQYKDVDDQIYELVNKEIINTQALKDNYNQGKLTIGQASEYKEMLKEQIKNYEELASKTRKGTYENEIYNNRIKSLKQDLKDMSKTYVPTVKLDLKDSKSKADDLASTLKNKIAKTFTSTLNMKIGTRDAKNQVTNFIKKTSNAMSFSGILNKVKQSTLNALLAAIPAYDVGTNYVPNDQLAMVHKGEAIVPKKFNNEQFFNSNNEETNALLVEVNQNLIELRNRPNVLAVNGKELAQATYNDFQNEGGRLNQSMTIKKVGGN